MYSVKVISMFAIFVMTVLFNFNHSTPINILAIYEKSFYVEVENGPLHEKPDDEGQFGTIFNIILYRTTLKPLIPKHFDFISQIHLVTVFYQGSYI